MYSVRPDFVNSWRLETLACLFLNHLEFPNFQVLGLKNNFLKQTERFWWFYVISRKEKFEPNFFSQKINTPLFVREFSSRHNLNNFSERLSFLKVKISEPQLYIINGSEDIFHESCSKKFVRCHFQQHILLLDIHTSRSIYFNAHLVCRLLTMHFCSAGNALCKQIWQKIQSRMHFFAGVSKKGTLSNREIKRNVWAPLKMNKISYPPQN